ncbi:MAG TPA: AI-2E family transporter [Bacteroidia bacterium]|nr:AI-2E family transporter [Bacteroidia bacterium]
MNNSTSQEDELITEKLKAPTVLRSSLVLFLFILLGCILVFAKQILVPVVFSILLAMLMSPLGDALERKRVNRGFSSLICVLILILVIGGIFLFVGKQFESLGKDMPKIQEKATSYLTKLQTFIGYKFDVSPQEQKDAFKSISKSLMQSGGSSAKNALAAITGVFANFVLVFIFTFLLLFHREKYNRFILKLCKGSDPEQAEKVLQKIGKVSQKYLIGRMMSMSFLFILFTTGFLIAGTKHAILLSLMSALLTIVPYLGSIVGGVFPVVMTLITGDSDAALIVLGVVVGVQAIDNYVIEPNVVGGQVNLSALSTILILIIGGYVWGVAGMILFIPMLGIAKIAFDHIEGLEPYGYLIGDQKKKSPSSKWGDKIKKLFKKK